MVTARAPAWAACRGLAGTIGLRGDPGGESAVLERVTYCTAVEIAAGTLCFIEIRRLRSGFMFIFSSGTRRSALMVLSGTKKYWGEPFEEDD
jgi:hypothetical protein